MSNTFPSLSWQEAWPTVVIVDETETTYRVLCRESVTHSRKVKDAKFTDLDEILGYVLWKSILLGSGLMTAGKHSILTDTWFFYTHCARRYLTADQSLCKIVVSYARKKNHSKAMTTIMQSFLCSGVLVANLKQQIV